MGLLSTWEWAQAPALLEEFWGPRIQASFSGNVLNARLTREKAGSNAQSLSHSVSHNGAQGWGLRGAVRGHSTMIPGLLGPVVWQNGHLHRYSTLQFTRHLPIHFQITRLHAKLLVCPSHSRDPCFGFLCNPQTFSLSCISLYSLWLPF